MKIKMECKKEEVIKPYIEVYKLTNGTVFTFDGAPSIPYIKGSTGLTALDTGRHYPNYGADEAEYTVWDKAELVKEGC